MMKLGERARILGVRPETNWAMERANEVMIARGYPCTITSVVDRTHQMNSLHYIGHAFDFDISCVNTDEWKEVVDDLEDVLGFDFDVVLNAGQKIIHVEFQPEKGLNL